MKLTIPETITSLASHVGKTGTCVYGKERPRVSAKRKRQRIRDCATGPDWVATAMAKEESVRGKVPRLNIDSYAELQKKKLDLAYYKIRNGTSRLSARDRKMILEIYEKQEDLNNG
jgi:hypothetical protein